MKLENSMTVSFLHPTMHSFLACPPNEPMSDDAIRAYWREMKNGQRDLSEPLPLTVSSDTDIVISGGGIRQTYPSINGTVTIANLIPNENHTCEVNGDKITFTTADEPRVLLIDGISNSRDFGGKTGLGGRKVNYGMIFRTQELDSVKPCGMDFLREAGIRTDLDLRSESEAHRSVLSFAEHIHVPVAPYGEVFLPEQAPLWHKIFSLLANETRYPMVIHCVGGIDRTGTLCILLGLLLGVDESVLASDYEFSGFAFTNFTERSRFSESYTALTDGLRRFDSDLHKAAELWLKSIGVTDDEIETARNILLSD